ncbi:putative permease [Halobacteroides halobius DSM 5150]|uniref:Putative permease n=1 Tax=Halobacteroides halobius (strain ATCC 35273 / DSM 5150 / MD-1) TaxID=748449 RepID=L0K9U5_HALHC|nr:permease [Halobacteroides halobius]AGB42087.1 putative permease [Halobacteroides halobius DSM 5150]
MIDWFADLVVYNWFGLSKVTRWGESVHFFVYDTIKILLLLTVMIFFISIIRSFFPPEKTKKLLSHRRKYVGNTLAALLGIVTPFCSCSSVPIFIGFIESGVPLGITFSFLITSPIVNEVALVMLYSLFGWKIGTLYLISGLVVGIVGGIIIGSLGLEDEVEEYVYQIQMDEDEVEEKTWQDRIKYAKGEVKEIVGRVWKYVIIGIAIGALIHGYAPASLLAKYAGEGNPLSVIVAVLLGIPLYSNAVGTIPIAQALINKGVGLGTALSFMMATVALSFPEMVILRKVIKPKLIGIFIAVVGTAIIGVGYLFDFVSLYFNIAL